MTSNYKKKQCDKTLKSTTTLRSDRGKETKESPGNHKLIRSKVSYTPTTATHKSISVDTLKGNVVSHDVFEGIRDGVR